MSDMEFDFRKAMLELANDYMERYLNPPPPKPAMFPQWQVDLAKLNGIDLDALCREHGFDGYDVYKLP